MTPKPAPRISRIFVRPSRKGLRVPVPGPARRYLPEEGALVPLDAYWSRRIRSGDVTTPSEAGDAIENVIDDDASEKPKKKPRS